MDKRQNERMRALRDPDLRKAAVLKRRNFIEALPLAFKENLLAFEYRIPVDAG
jgi:hypothetical protein